MIPKVMSVVTALNPKSILDVGPGNGRYGMLFRECLDWNYGRLSRDTWQLRLCGIELDPTYITPVHQYVYDKVDVWDWLYFGIKERYNLIFMGDVLEHWPEPLWQQALAKANEYGDYVIVVSPNWKGSLAQGSWHGHHQEKHWAILSPQAVGGRCLFANSKMFMCAFDNLGSGLLENRNVCL